MIKDGEDRGCKLFVGGLDYNTTDESLKAHFDKYGETIDVIVMRDGMTRKSRGFGFVTYSQSHMADEAMNSKPHIVDGRSVDTKRATSRGAGDKSENNDKSKKLFLGGIKDLSEDELRNEFSQYGEIVEVRVPVDRETNRQRGFAFITFSDFDSADRAIVKSRVTIGSTQFDVRKSTADRSMPVRGAGPGGFGGDQRRNSSQGGYGGGYQGNQGGYDAQGGYSTGYSGYQTGDVSQGGYGGGYQGNQGGYGTQGGHSGGYGGYQTGNVSQGGYGGGYEANQGGYNTEGGYSGGYGGSLGGNVSQVGYYSGYQGNQGGYSSQGGYTGNQGESSSQAGYGGGYVAPASQGSLGSSGEHLGSNYDQSYSGGAQRGQGRKDQRSAPYGGDRAGTSTGGGPY